MVSISCPMCYRCEQQRRGASRLIYGDYYLLEDLSSGLKITNEFAPAIPTTCGSDTIG